MIGYKEKDGTILKGFSQVDLDELNKRQKFSNYLLTALVILGYATFLMCLFILYQVMRYDLVTKWLSCG